MARKREGHPGLVARSARICTTGLLLLFSCGEHSLTSVPLHRLPSVTTGARDVHAPSTFVVTVFHDGRVLVGGEQVLDTRHLEQRLAEVADGHRPRRGQPAISRASLLLRLEAGTPFAALQAVLDACCLSSVLIQDVWCAVRGAASPTEERRLSVSIPKDRGSSTEPFRHWVDLSVGGPTSERTLQPGPEFRRALGEKVGQRRPKPHILLSLDPAVTVDAALEIIGQARSLGFRHIALQTSRPAPRDDSIAEQIEALGSRRITQSFVSVSDIRLDLDEEADPERK